MLHLSLVQFVPRRNALAACSLGFLEHFFPFFLGMGTGIVDDVFCRTRLVVHVFSFAWVHICVLALQLLILHVETVFEGLIDFVRLDVHANVAGGASLHRICLCEVAFEVDCVVDFRLSGNGFFGLLVFVVVPFVFGFIIIVENEFGIVVGVVFKVIVV